jgi:threonine/homoserine/homoserine lactone efflux protein
MHHGWDFTRMWINMEDPILFVSSVIVLLITPGPTNTLLASSAAMTGFRRSLRLLLWELLGYCIAILLIEWLATRLLTSARPLTVLLRLVSATYIALLAVRLWNGHEENGPQVISAKSIFLVTLLNPKAVVFALVVVPFRSPHVLVYLITLMAIIPVVGTTWMVLGDTLGQRELVKYTHTFS